MVEWRINYNLSWIVWFLLFYLNSIEIDKFIYDLRNFVYYVFILNEFLNE